MTDKARYTPEVWQAITSAARQGEEYERDRILDLIKSYWCGEPECKQHTTNWPHLIENIKGNI